MGKKTKTGRGIQLHPEMESGLKRIEKKRDRHREKTKTKEKRKKDKISSMCTKELKSERA